MTDSDSGADAESNVMWQSRPLVQDAKLPGHVELTFPASRESVVVDDEIARRLAEDIFRVVHGHTAAEGDTEGDEA